MDNIQNLIRQRHSVRTFSGLAMDSRMEDAVRTLIAGMSNPFGANPTVKAVATGPTSIKAPGTYGVIKNARNYLLMAYGEGQTDALAAGYAMERIVLGATALGLGTCWMGGTFKSGDFSRMATFPDNVKLKIIIPIGIPAEKPRLMERIGKKLMGSTGRRPFGTMFFNGDFSTPLLPTPMAAGEALEMMRLAPSSLNSQPWRAVADGAYIHFYQKDGKFSTLDCGIGLCHFALTMEAQGACGNWHHTESHPDAPRGVSYLISFRIDR